MKTITNITKNIMGTISFDAKFIGMRKAQDFIVYPISGEVKKILCQSDNRWLEIDTETGKCEITSSASGHHNRWLLSIQKAQGKHKEFTLPAADLQELKMCIFTTADKNAGSSFVKTDNSGAISIL